MEKGTLSRMTPKRRGARLRMLREAHGITMLELADECGIDLSTVSYYESGKRRLSNARCDQLNAGITKVLERRKLEGRFQRLLRAEAGEVDEIMADLSEAEKDVLVQMLEAHNAKRQKELTELKKTEAELTARSKESEPLANVMDIIGPVGQAIGDLLAPPRPGAQERREQQTEPRSSLYLRELHCLLNNKPLSALLSPEEEKAVRARWEKEYAEGKDLLRRAAELPPDYLEHPVIKELMESYQRELEEKEQKSLRPVAEKMWRTLCAYHRLLPSVSQKAMATLPEPYREALEEFYEAAAEIIESNRRGNGDD